MRRLFSAAIAAIAFFGISVTATPAATAVNSIQMNLDQTILVWNSINYPDFSNYDIQMSTVSTLTGEAAPIGYTFQPALDPAPCPAPYQSYNYCGGAVTAAALNPVSSDTYGLVGGADAPYTSLYKINPQTAEPTFVATVTLPNGSRPFNVNGLYFDQSQGLHTWWKPSGPNTNYELYTLNEATGVMAQEGTILTSAFTGSLMEMQYDAAGNLWAFTVNVQQSGTTTYAYSVDPLLNFAVSQEFTLPGIGLLAGDFDANGYLWFQASGDEFYAMDVTDPANTLELKGSFPAMSSAFVISDVPFATSSGVTTNQTLTANSGFELSILNARAGSNYSVEIHSTPVSLATGAVSNFGQANLSLTIPATVPSGNHTLVLSYLAPNGQTITQEIPVTVSNSLAATGARPDLAIWIGLGTISLGALVLAAFALRRRAVRI